MKMTKFYKVILADDHILLRDSLANLITSFREFKVVAKATNGVDVIDVIRKGEEADILLMDLNMPEMDGFETASLLIKEYPQLKIIILTMYETEMLLMRLLQLGVMGFLKKDIHPRELKKALLTVAAGEYYYNSQTAEKIISLFRKKTNNELTLEEVLLDAQEIEFIKLACTNMRYTEIADAMKFPNRYIEKFRRKLFDKLRVESRVELTIYAMTNGIITF